MEALYRRSTSQWGSAVGYEAGECLGMPGEEKWRTCSRFSLSNRAGEGDYPRTAPSPEEDTSRQVEIPFNSVIGGQCLLAGVTVWKRLPRALRSGYGRVWCWWTGEMSTVFFPVVRHHRLLALICRSFHRRREGALCREAWHFPDNLWVKSGSSVDKELIVEGA